MQLPAFSGNTRRLSPTDADHEPQHVGQGLGQMGWKLQVSQEYVGAERHECFGDVCEPLNGFMFRYDEHYVVGCEERLPSCHQDWKITAEEKQCALK